MLNYKNAVNGTLLIIN